MTKPRQTSVVVLITLAELAWLAAFGLLCAYRIKVSELRSVSKALSVATNEVVMLRASAQDPGKLIAELKIARENTAQLQSSLNELTNQLRGKAPEEVWKLFVAAEDAATRAIASEAAARNAAEEIARRASDSSNRLAKAALQLTDAWGEIAGLSNKIEKLRIGEIAIRRELTGLPTNELRRVAFIVDTSSSMHGSRAWGEAKELMRTWIEHLSVQECVLINFNDRAFAFPSQGYLRIREAGGNSILASNMTALINRFDNSRPGTYSDLRAGLREAYKRPGIDLIVLFTDGHPHIPTQGDSSYAVDILKEVEKKREVPILTVAVGSYEIEGAGGPRQRSNPAITFLKRLAQASGGTFIGR